VITLTSKQRRWFLRKYRRPRKTTPAIRAEIQRKYFERKEGRPRAKQLDLALEYGVTQATIARIVSGSYYNERGRSDD
jgi:DNA-directed RNA polymerase specialized sigma54-like protein